MASELLSLMGTAFRYIFGWTSDRAQGALGSWHLIQAWAWAGVGGAEQAPSTSANSHQQVPASRLTRLPDGLQQAGHACHPLPAA